MKLRPILLEAVGPFFLCSFHNTPFYSFLLIHDDTDGRLPFRASHRLKRTFLELRSAHNPLPRLLPFIWNIIYHDEGLIEGLMERHFCPNPAGTC
jgi:hypothetical protein